MIRLCVEVWEGVHAEDQRPDIQRISAEDRAKIEGRSAIDRPTPGLV
jgi:hypothetical protein